MEYDKKLMDEKPTADILKETRKRLRMTQHELSEKLGISRDRWARYEYGHSNIPSHISEKLFALEAGRIYDQGFASGGAHDARPASMLFGTMSEIPVVGQTAAGDGATNVDPDNEPIWVPQSLANLGGLGFVIDGESMMPALQPGDVAVFKQSHTPRRGFTYLVKTPRDEFRCKNLEWKNNEWTLVSLNHSYPDEQLGEAQVLGVLVGWYRSIGTYEKLEADPHGLRLDVV